MDAPVEALLQRLSRLVIKDEVGLGGLAQADLDLALLVVWRCLPEGEVHSEPAVNALLKTALAGGAAWLDVDHVELRRWMVDTGWLSRDGWGREYRRVAVAALPPAQRALAEAAGATDLVAWVAEQRVRHQQAREARRRHWAASAGGGR